MRTCLGSRFVVASLAALGFLLATAPGTATAAGRTGQVLPTVQVTAAPQAPSVTLEVQRLTVHDRLELSLPAGLGEANGLEREWSCPDHSFGQGMERWIFPGTRGDSIAVALDMTGLEPGERGLFSVFSTDPATGDVLQAHWWLVAGDEGVHLASAGAERVRNMVRLTLGAGAPRRWTALPHDPNGRLLLRRSDPRLRTILPWAVRQEPFIEVRSISTAEATGQVSASTSADLDFTNFQCEYWYGMVLSITSAPSDATITTFDVHYTVYHSVDTSRYKAEVARPAGNVWQYRVPLYNGTYSGHNWQTLDATGRTEWAGLHVNYDYVLGFCNIYGHEYAYMDAWSITLYYNTGGGGGGSVDLVADSVRTDFDTIAAGGQLGYYYEAHVGGSGNVGSSFNTGLYLSTDAGISTSDRLLATIPEPATLAAGDQFGARMFSRQVIIPSDVAPGTYWLGILLDDGNIVAETDEGNNTVSRQITIVPASSKPNLKASGCSVSSSHVASGGDVTLSYRGQNTGATGAAYFSDAIFVSTDQHFDGSDQLIMGLDMPGGWPAGSDTGTLSATFSLSGLADGTYYVGYALDVGNQVPETDETDNYCVAQITIGSGGSSGITHWIIPGAASTSGLHGANWKTQISIVNPDSSSHTVNLHYVPTGQSWPGTLLAGPIDLGPNQAWFRDDVLGGLRPTSGMMYVVADSPGPVVTTRTYNDVSGYGRFGQGVPGGGMGADHPTVLYLPMARSAPNEYHTNLGIVQADSGSITVQVTLYNSSGGTIGVKSYTQSAAFRQITNIFKDMGHESLNIDDAWIRVRLMSGSPAYWTVYAAIVDESTGDPTFVTPVAP